MAGIKHAELTPMGTHTNIQTPWLSLAKHKKTLSCLLNL